MRSVCREIMFLDAEDHGRFNAGLDLSDKVPCVGLAIDVEGESGHVTVCCSRAPGPAWTRLWMYVTISKEAPDPSLGCRPGKVTRWRQDPLASDNSGDKTDTEALNCG